MAVVVHVAHTDLVLSRPCPPHPSFPRHFSLRPSSPSLPPPLHLSFFPPPFLVSCSLSLSLCLLLSPLQPIISEQAREDGGGGKGSRAEDAEFARAGGVEDVG
eukprot:137502-Rhodomonas_salina.2